MRCLAFRHLPHEGLGILRRALRDRGWEVDERDIRVPEDVPRGAAGSAADLLIVLGGPMSVSDPDSAPTMPREIEIVRARLEIGRPVLGLCLGAQMMAAALGARVYAGSRPEVGWHPVDLEPTVEGDPLFAELVRPSPVALHWHQDTFDLPDGGIRLARSELYANQAFRYGPNSYAIQFHPEVPVDDLPEWVAKSHIPLDRPRITPTGASIIEGGERWGEAAARQAHAFITGYLRRLEETRRVREHDIQEHELPKHDLPKHDGKGRPAKTQSTH